MSLRSRLRRLSIHGDYLTRFMEWGGRNCPSWLEPLFIGSWSLIVFILLPALRRSVAGNLRAMFPDWSWCRAQFGALRVIWNFSWTMADALRAAGGQDVIDWEIDGLTNFQKLSASDGGAIVLTAHMGNYDLAAPMFAERFGRRLNAVRAPERDPALQEHFERRREEEQSEAFAVRYNREGQMLGVELASLLDRGELVALQGDRVLFEVSPVQGELFGRTASLPKGPFALAMASGAPVWPLFIVRDAWRRYRIVVGRSFRIAGARSERKEAMQAGITTWCAALESVLSNSWHQWFVYEPVFEPQGEVSS